MLNKRGELLKKRLCMQNAGAGPHVANFQLAGINIEGEAGDSRRAC